MFYPFLLALAHTYDISSILRLSTTLANSERPLDLSSFHWAAIINALSDTHTRKLQEHLHNKHSLSNRAGSDGNHAPGKEEINEDIARMSGFRTFSEKFRTFLEDMAPLTAEKSFPGQIRLLHSKCVSAIERIDAYATLDTKGVGDNVAASKFISSYEPRASDVTEPLSEEKIEVPYVFVGCLWKQKRLLHAVARCHDKI